MKGKGIEILMQKEKGENYAVFLVPENAVIENCDYEISKAPEPKTVKENKHLWAILNEISHFLGRSPQDVYKSLLAASNVKTEVKYILDEELDAYEEQFRCVKILDKPDSRHVFVKVYYGASKMNKDEILFLIDAAEKWKAKIISHRR